MTDATLTQEVVDEVQPAAPATKKSLDPGFKRNVLIITGALLIAVILIAAVVLAARSRFDGADARAGQTSIAGTGAALNGSSPTALTPADIARQGRVQTRESDAARETKDTYIPKDLTIKAESLPPPAAAGGGAGQGYSYSTGGQTSQQADPQRDANIRRGIELQLNSMLARMEAPTTQSATPYVEPGKTPGPTSAALASAPAASTSTVAEVVIAKGLSIAGARLVSPLDTSKTEFISAVVTSGPLAGAYLVGKGRMVGEEGVQMSFNRMTFAGESYAVNVTALDNQTSSDAIAADIDRKLLSRFVMPVTFTTLQAYLGAVARPSSQLVATSAVSTQIITPSATAREAVATGIAAGLGKAGEAFGQAKPSAYMPIDAGISLLFNDPVKKAAK